MRFIFNDPKTKAQLQAGDIGFLKSFTQYKKTENYTFIRSGNSPVSIIVDHLPMTLAPFQIISLNPNQRFVFKGGKEATIYQFNREFYCIKDHDREVNCMGVLFFSNELNPIFQLNEKEHLQFERLHEDIVEEFTNEDSIQEEMLQLLLKNFIIKSTRILKKQLEYSENNSSKHHLLKQFNILVEEFYKKEHQVKFYADQLFKSPKTLSNTFHDLGTSPLQIIQNRIVEETKRLLLYSDKSFKEIAFELGYYDASHLSRLFKNQVKIAPTLFKKSNPLKKIGLNT